jgi:GTPase SAR1 family protein
MKGAWEEFRSELADIERKKEAHEEKIDSKFRKVFINLMTETFADELDDLRHGRVRVDTRKKDKKQLPVENIPDILMQENIVMPVQCMNENVGEDVNVDVKVLVDMLESGMDGWNASEKELILQDWKNKSRKHHDDTEEEDQQVMTPHERRKREIFGENAK